MPGYAFDRKIVGWVGAQMDIWQKEWSSSNGGTELGLPTNFGGIHLVFEFCLQKDTKNGSHCFIGIIIFKNYCTNIYEWSVFIG